MIGLDLAGECTPDDVVSVLREKQMLITFPVIAPNVGENVKPVCRVEPDVASQLTLSSHASRSMAVNSSPPVLQGEGASGTSGSSCLAGISTCRVKVEDGADVDDVGTTADSLGHFLMGVEGASCTGGG